MVGPDQSSLPNSYLISSAKSDVPLPMSPPVCQFMCFDRPHPGDRKRVRASDRSGRLV
jgi:hypothetical protein